MLLDNNIMNVTYYLQSSSGYFYQIWCREINGPTSWYIYTPAVATILTLKIYSFSSMGLISQYGLAFSKQKKTYTSLYFHRKSNHPPYIIKNLEKGNKLRKKNYIKRVTLEMLRWNLNALARKHSDTNTNYLKKGKMTITRKNNIYY